MQMSTFDLFDKIEDSAVLLQPHGDVDMKRIEKMTMKKLNAGKARTRRPLGAYFLAAALITFLLATSVFAYVGFTQYENPIAMMDAFFGNTALPSLEGKEVEMTYFDKEYTVQWPEVQRVPLDETVASEAAPPISAVGQSVSFDGNTVTVIAHQHDAPTGVGTVYITVENPAGVSGYKTQYDGEVWWPGGELIRMTNCQHKNYIVPGQTDDTKLTVACYYVGANWYEEEYLKMHFSGTEEVLQLSLNIFEDTASLISGNKEVILSALGMELRLADMDFLYWKSEDGVTRPPLDDNDIHYLSIRMKDGSKYVVMQERDDQLIHNFSYRCGTDLEESGAVCAYVFNRIVDLEQVEAVIINDTEYTF